MGNQEVKDILDSLKTNPDYLTEMFNDKEVDYIIHYVTGEVQLNILEVGKLEASDIIGHPFVRSVVWFFYDLSGDRENVMTRHKGVADKAIKEIIDTNKPVIISAHLSKQLTALDKI